MYIYIYMYIYIQRYIYIYRYISIPYRLFPIGYPLLAIPYLLFLLAVSCTSPIPMVSRCSSCGQWHRWHRLQLRSCLSHLFHSVIGHTEVNPLAHLLSYGTSRSALTLTSMMTACTWTQMLQLM